tara:strand:- start:59 stop:1330 length:1272 start_codon:yes stop_codon:yes gene_type:complete
MNKAIKNMLLKIPAVREKYALLMELREKGLLSEIEINRLHKVIEASRSPGLASSSEDMLTERLLAHPANSPLPNIELTSIPATAKDNRVEIADRLITAYHKALSDEKESPIKRDGEDLWTGLLRKELPDLMESIDKKDPVALSEFLMSFGSSYVWFGGITTCVDGYNKNLDRKQVALSYLDKLVCLAESLGVLRMENPEHGPWGENLFVEPSEIVKLIEQELEINISAPLGIIHTDGIKAGDGCFHYRHINSLYSAMRASRLTKKGDSVCEIGGGLGLTAMYAQRLGIGHYTILDLPITCLLAGHYLLHAVGEDKVSLYGEKQSNNTTVQLLPYWDCVKQSNNNYSLVLNQDSLPEIADNLVYEFLRQVKRTSNNLFLSINHECFYPRTVRNFTRDIGSFKEIYRSKCWVREGYIEELYSITK